MSLQQLLFSVMNEFVSNAVTEICQRLKHEETSHTEV